MQLFIEKYNGLGNDFLIVDERSNSGDPLLQLSQRIALSNRHRGIGADGIITVLKPKTPGALVRMHITNSDGSIPEMCGNGLRCLSRWLVDKKIANLGQIQHVDTDAGVRLATCSESDVTVDMGLANFDTVAASGSMENVLVKAKDEEFRATAVSMGNPHLVVKAAPDPKRVTQIGPILERHPNFPERTNVGFASMTGAKNIVLGVWERGAGYTLACGTGACAAAAVAVRAGQSPADEWIQVGLPGGSLEVMVPSGNSGIQMRGTADFSWSGTIDFPR
jgi:diaminopimelate epimerase